MLSTGGKMLLLVHGGIECVSLLDLSRMARRRSSVPVGLLREGRSGSLTCTVLEYSQAWEETVPSHGPVVVGRVRRCLGGRRAHWHQNAGVGLSALPVTAVIVACRLPRMLGPRGN